MAKPARPTLEAKNARKLVRRLDGWSNALTGIGQLSKDKRLSGVHLAERIDQQTAEDLWRGDDMAARIIETVPDEMTREGYDVRIEGKKELAEATEAMLDTLDASARLHDGLCYARAYGGGAVLMGAIDGQSLVEPLELARVKSLDWLTVLTPGELVPVEFYADPTHPSYGEPSIYRIQQSVHRTMAPTREADYPLVHESRLIRFQGARVSRKQLRDQHWWGDSVLVRCAHVIRDFQMTWAGASLLLADFAQAVLKIKNLADLLASDDEGNAVVRRAELVDLSRSVARTIVMDSEEDFERKATPLSGMPEMLQQMALRLAAAARIPVTILMGQSPAGLNATGASDIRWFYDTVASQQRRTLQPAINRLLEVLFNAKKGPTGGKEPENWTVAFRPLWQLTEQEEAELRNKQANTDQVYISQGVLLPEEVAVSRFGGDAYSTDTKLDDSTRKAMEPVELEPGATPLVGDPLKGLRAPPGTAPTATPRGAAAPVDPLAVDPQSALNGAQVTALLEILTAVAESRLPRDSGIEVMVAAFPIDRAQATRIMGSIGAGFKPAVPEPAPIAAGPRPTQPPAERLNSADPEGSK